VTNLGVFGDTVQSCDLKTGPVAELNMERAMNKRLEGKRVLITQARDFMGPALCDVLVEHGAIVLADESPLSAPDAAERVVRAAGTVDILVANLAIPVLVAPAAEVGDDGWRATFAAIVDPLPRLARALLPAMIARRSGKFLVMSSATALRGQSLTSTYCSARGAQLAWAQSAGVELAQHNVQVNAIAFNFLDNPTYFPAEKQADPRFQERLKREVPLGRMVSAGEGAEFAAYLCSAAADCFVGQVFPVCGGWLQR
jgi:2-keto-3-deoxy-L-fuconate dehydrogenase